MIRILALLMLLPALAAARMVPAISIPAASALCRMAINGAERAARVPDRLMDAVAVVESGRRDPVSGAVYPWPWTINAEGVGHWYETKAEAVAAVRDFQARGVRSIDVGCMQVNLMHHASAFTSLEEAFDPAANAAYAARFLQQLLDKTNAWPLAVGAYHSFTPELGAEYARKVMAAWGVPQLPAGAQALSTPHAPSSASNLPSRAMSAALPPAATAALPPMGSEAPRMQSSAAAMPVAAGSGRGLDAYRAMPIALSMRMARLR